MVAALYRRYRPDTFADMIGQAQVTEPLRTALRTGRVNHAYLFSGPRGCGKTTSARVLARCMNCAQGPTDTPCGECDSCRELATGGGGSLDVIEIDAASHGGVDDARDLRERAVLAPSRDRYKVFIIDEAHMVTSAGFNALLKVVEEPPEHVRFVFATTEPEKVIGTIRSRTHHFPFRLIPPAVMLEYVEQLTESEGVTADPGVLPLVVRAGGGSARDTLSLLDQIIAGSEGTRIDYERAAALLGFTAIELLDGTIDAFARGDAAAAYRVVDGVVQSGQDPRRFVEDLLERVRDLIVVKATGQGAASVLHGASPAELEQLMAQAARFAPAGLSAMADLVNETLTEMTGVTSPRLHLELMTARILVASRATFSGDGDASVDAAPIERRPDAASASSAPVAGASGAAPEPIAPVAPTAPTLRPAPAA
ncbi:MAG: DNA polymerase III subunit gamma and tau, partial [Pseudoclavibacter sp.]